MSLLSARDRRKDTRYEVELDGSIEYEGAWYDVTVSDVSASGALIMVEGRFTRGATLVLHIQELGTFEAEIAHAGSGFCGLQFVNPAAHRDQLTDWLRRMFGNSLR
jgi:hypothetical protein